jgi:hypothetical protein
VCGFDLLRGEQSSINSSSSSSSSTGHNVTSHVTTSGASLVCDVNGWSFVKQHPRYSEDCAALLCRCMLQALRPAAAVTAAVTLATAAAAATTTTTTSTALSTAAAHHKHKQQQHNSTSDCAGSGSVAVTSRTSSACDSDCTAPLSPRSHRSSGADTILHNSACGVIHSGSRARGRAGSSSSAGANNGGAEGRHYRSDTDNGSGVQGCRGDRHERLRAVIAIIRHGDRTPKEKVSSTTSCYIYTC